MENLNFWQGEKVGFRGIEPKDCETMFQWRLDSEHLIGLIIYHPSFLRVL